MILSFIPPRHQHFPVVSCVFILRALYLRYVTAKRWSYRKWEKSVLKRTLESFLKFYHIFEKWLSVADEKEEILRVWREAHTSVVTMMLLDYLYRFYQFRSLQMFLWNILALFRKGKGNGPISFLLKLLRVVRVLKSQFLATSHKRLNDSRVCLLSLWTTSTHSQGNLWERRKKRSILRHHNVQ